MDYPSHSFVIDRKEAGELFAHVSHPTDEETRLYESLWNELQDESHFRPTILPGRHKQEKQNDEIRQINAGHATPIDNSSTGVVARRAASSVREVRQSRKNDE